MLISFDFSICSLLRIFACQCSQEHIFFMCVYNVHGRVTELWLSRCLALLSVVSEAGWWDGRASVTWPMCVRIYAFFLVFYITIWYWISTILATNKGSFTCAYLLFTWFYLSFIAFIICFYCLYVSMRCQKWRNKTAKSVNIEPCGTPVDMGKGEDTLSSIWTYCILPLL